MIRNGHDGNQPVDHEGSCLGENGISQLPNGSQDFFRLSFGDQIRGTFPIKELLPSEQPHSCFLWFIEIGELVDDPFQLKKQSFSVRMWKGPALIPARNGFRTRSEDVGNVYEEQSAFVPNRFKFLCDRTHSDPRSISPGFHVPYRDIRCSREARVSECVGAITSENRCEPNSRARIEAPRFLTLVTRCFPCRGA